MMLYTLGRAADVIIIIIEAIFSIPKAHPLNERSADSIMSRRCCSDVACWSVAKKKKRHAIGKQLLI